ncbi:MAG: PAS domain S-box protein [Candidatus Omnitrophica bacterium]|nr:PAS domain S-box protein [Candidatus Omnitrophota bacterium]
MKGKIVPFFPIVGIGASAGGLEASEDLLKNLSDKPGMAFVFIMHLSPNHKSLLPELFARTTKMPVKEIKNGMLIEVNHVYVKPPDTNLAIQGRKLILSKRSNNDFKHMPIDYFFRSLAEELGNRSIGVILSGTASDGTLGAEAIKAEGGIVFAQDEKSSRYSGMPQSAVVAGCVDFVLSPKKIVLELRRIVKHPFMSSVKIIKANKLALSQDKGFVSIFALLRQNFGLDFTHYKATTISRRISRRMLLLGLKNIKDYIKLLSDDKKELSNLYEDLLLKVTGFFRDEKAFEVLKKKVLPLILKNQAKNQQIRIWIPGCSTGEEVYSIAMCFVELIGDKSSTARIKIFATDVSEICINKARRGIYSENIKGAVSSERLKRFFSKQGNFYKISKNLRDMCIFSKQNVFSDPPFSNLDLISCRNLLIYFQPVLQKKAFHNFHYGLKPGGFLFLGSSESVGGYLNLFKPLDRKEKIFIKKYVSIGPELQLEERFYPLKKVEIKKSVSIKKEKETDFESLIEQAMLREYAPCGVLIDSDMEVVSFRGHTGSFLESAVGKPSHNVFKLVRDGLFLPLRAAITQARQTKHTVKKVAQDVKHNGHRRQVQITVIPIKYGIPKEEFFLVFFDEVIKTEEFRNLPKARSNDKNANLQKELLETKEYLQTVIEEQESANEEVKTANEEILSSNEELQSTNEELETAKEELQSANEELITSNEELQNRNAEVSLLNNDLVNLLSSINMPVVMMGTDLSIRRITPQAEKVLNVASSDIGKPITSIKLNINIPDLENMLLEVVDTFHSKSLQIKSKDMRWYSVYIRPYRTLDNKIDGVVMIFVDITDRKYVEDELARVKEREYRALVENLPQMIFLKDINSNYISCNENFAKNLKIKPKDIFGKTDFDFFPKELADKYKADDQRVMSAGKTEEIEEKYIQEGKEVFVHTLKAPLKDDHGNVIGLFGLFWDITELKQAEEALRLSESKVRAIFDQSFQFIGLMTLDGVLIEANNTAMQFAGIKKSDCLGKFFWDTPWWTHSAEMQNKLRKAITKAASGESVSFEATNIAADKNLHYIDFSLKPVKDKNGKVTFLVPEGRDITDRKKSEIALRESEEKFRTIFDNAVDGIILADKVSQKFFLANNAICKMLGYSNEEIKDLTVMDIHPEKDISYVIEQFKKQAKGEISLAREIPVKRKDGSIFYADINSSPIVISGKEYLMGFFHDVTELKLAEEDRRRVMDEKTSSELRTKFTSMVSHELRSPLTVIKEGINLVIEGLTGSINPEQKELLETAKNNIDRLGRLINNVLDFQKIEAGKMVFNIRIDDINNVVLEIHKSMDLIAKEKNLFFILDLDNNVPKIRFDRDRIIQVITNLVSNAIKYTEKGSIKISTKYVNNSVIVAVQDTGPGVDAKDLNRLFHAFEQLDSPRDKKKGGTGLGLAISKDIILAHKGKIWADSELGKGATFYFALPVKERRG